MFNLKLSNYITMKNFKQLLIWQKGMKLVLDIYAIAEKLPRTENYGLRSQLTRSAISIPSNIAEGSSRQSQKEYKYYIEIALGSAFELETQLSITKRLALVDFENDIKCDHVLR